LRPPAAGVWRLLSGKHFNPSALSNHQNKEKHFLLKKIEENRNTSISLKRKLPLPPMQDVKSPKIDNNVNKINHISKYKNQASTTNKIHNLPIFKKPFLPVLDKNTHSHINNSVKNKRQKSSTSYQIKNNKAVLKTNKLKQVYNKMGQIIPSKPMNTKYIEQKPSTSGQITSNISESQTSENDEGEQKPLLKCLPFTKDGSDDDQHVGNLATCLNDNNSNMLPEIPLNSELTDPSLNNFNTIRSNNTIVRSQLTNDPIVRDYIQQTQMQIQEPKRKCKLPESMLSLPEEILKLIPDNYREIKQIVEFYHSMATVIVKVLDMYVKKNCKQGRIKNDEDFKYLAKKVNIFSKI